MPLGLILIKGKSLPAPFCGIECTTSKTDNVGEDQMNPGIRIIPLSSANDLLGGSMSGQSSEHLLDIRTGNYP